MFTFEFTFSCFTSFACCGLCICGDCDFSTRYAPAMQQTMGDGGTYSYWQHYQEYLRGLQNSAATALSNSAAGASAPLRATLSDSSFPTLGSHPFSALPPKFEPTLLGGAYGNISGGNSSGSRGNSGGGIGVSSQVAGGGGFVAPTTQSAAAPGNYYEHKFATTWPPPPAPSPSHPTHARQGAFAQPAAAAAAASVAAVMAATAAFAADDTSTGSAATEGPSSDSGSRGGGEERTVVSLTDPWSKRARFDGNNEGASRSGENNTVVHQERGNNNCYSHGGGGSTSSSSSHLIGSNSGALKCGKSSSTNSNFGASSSSSSKINSTSSRSFDSCLGKRAHMSQKQTMHSGIGGSFHENDASRMSQLGAQDQSMSEAAALLSNLASSAPASREYRSKGGRTVAKGEEGDDEEEQEAVNADRAGSKNEGNQRFALRPASAAHSAQSASIHSATAAAIAELQMAQQHFAPNNFGLRNLRQGVVQFDLTVSKFKNYYKEENTLFLRPFQNFCRVFFKMEFLSHAHYELIKKL